MCPLNGQKFNYFFQVPLFNKVITTNDIPIYMQTLLKNGSNTLNISLSVLERTFFLLQCVVWKVNHHPGRFCSGSLLFQQCTLHLLSCAYNISPLDGNVWMTIQLLPCLFLNHLFFMHNITILFMKVIIVKTKTKKQLKTVKKKV